jgi:hypothetical protein
MLAQNRDMEENQSPNPGLSSNSQAVTIPQQFDRSDINHLTSNNSKKTSKLMMGSSSILTENTKRKNDSQKERRTTGASELSTSTGKNHLNQNQVAEHTMSSQIIKSLNIGSNVNII